MDSGLVADGISLAIHIKKREEDEKLDWRGASSSATGQRELRRARGAAGPHAQK
jgi:hypothetical protein